MSLKGKYADAHWAVKVLQWLGCIFVLSIPAMGCLVCFEQPLSVSSLKWIQLIQTAALFLLPPLCMAYLWSEKPLEWLKAKPTPRPFLKEGESGERRSGYGAMRPIGAAVLVMLLALPAVNMLSYWNQQMSLPAFLEPVEDWMRLSEENAKVLTEQFLNVRSLGGLVVNLLLMALLPALAEELTFRGVMMRLFEAKDERVKARGDEARVPHLAVWCSAILFSAIHMQFYGFLPRMLMGALFGYMLVWTGSLWVPIVMHLTNNAVAVVLYFVSLRMGWDMEKMDSIGSGDTLWLGIVSMVVSLVGIYIFRRSMTMSRASSRISKGS